jgi:hypothetical protein
MPAVLAISHAVTEADVNVAWATYRACIIAECDDPRLQHDPAHQLATSKARVQFARLYDEWCGR